MSTTEKRLSFVLEIWSYLLEEFSALVHFYAYIVQGVHEEKGALSAYCGGRGAYQTESM